jgi:eukaryotic-like serine/threonine-protein kinase
MASPEDGFVNGVYELLPGEPPACGGGQISCAVRDHRNGHRELIGVLAARDAPVRSVALGTLSGQAIENMILPIAHGVGRLPDGRSGMFVIQPRAVGQPVLDAAGRTEPWGERALIEHLIRPAALALDRLSHLGVTHRAIRGNNVFRPRAGSRITLGGAWAGPPGALQPSVFEPPYSAMCHPSGRGEGGSADDVYALGVLMLALAIGAVPLADLPPDEAIHRKLERGSYAALAGALRLPTSIADLARGMLAEDPDHRPPPVLLADPLAARSRRVAARPPPRAHTGLDIGGHTVWDARSLAYAAFRAPEEGMRLLRGPDIDMWLRRALGDPLLAARVDDAVRSAGSSHQAENGTADAGRLMHCIAALDPLAPCCWQGVALFPDGLGAMCAAADPQAGRSGLREKLTQLVQGDGLAVWAAAKGSRVDNALIHLDWRQSRVLLNIPGWAGGFPRLRYAQNPLLACQSALVGAGCVVRLHELLPALDANAQAAGARLVDAEIAAFISARMKGRLDAEFAVLAEEEAHEVDPPGVRGLAQLRVLARLAQSDPALHWSNIARAALPQAEAAVARWHAGSERAQRLERLRHAAQEGNLLAMLAALDDPASLHEDASGVDAAKGRIALLETTLSRIGSHRAMRRAAGRQTAQEIAAACGTILLVGVAVARTMF